MQGREIVKNLIKILDIIATSKKMKGEERILPSDFDGIKTFLN